MVVPFRSGKLVTSDWVEKLDWCNTCAYWEEIGLVLGAFSSLLSLAWTCPVTV
jgi:hypothetical protein